MPATSKEAALYQRLSTGPTVSALLGYGNAAKVYPVSRPEGAEPPLVEFQRISTPTDTTQEGEETDAARFQLTCWGNDPDTARLIGEAVLADIAGHRGTYGDRTISVLKIDEREDKDPTSARFRRLIDVVVW